MGSLFPVTRTAKPQSISAHGDTRAEYKEDGAPPETPGKPEIAVIFPGVSPKKVKRNSRFYSRHFESG
ncbi:hypothetical protein BK127_38415 [Paenibacillus sp. FSL H7-0331]|nr:hypothetical protein BK127_38415 [Paenibacillus sp. FSL H7-0331]